MGLTREQRQTVERLNRELYAADPGRYRVWTKKALALAEKEDISVKEAKWRLIPEVQGDSDGVAQEEGGRSAPKKAAARNSRLEEEDWTFGAEDFEGVDEKSVSRKQIVDWVAANILNRDVKVSDAPCRRAWALLRDVRQSREFRVKTFWPQVWSRIVERADKKEEEPEREAGDAQVLDTIRRLATEEPDEEPADEPVQSGSEGQG